MAFVNSEKMTYRPRENELANVEPVIISNDRDIFIRHDGPKDSPLLSPESFFDLCPSAVMDKETLKLIEVLRFHKAIDYTASSTGSAVLLRSLLQPSTDLHYIRSKQESLREIASNDRLCQALQDCIHGFQKEEYALYKFFNKGLYALFPYLDLKNVKKTVVNISKRIQAIPKAESSYLGELIARLQLYRGSSIDQMMRGSIYKTFRGLKSNQEVGFFTLKEKFTPRRFTRWVLAGPILTLTPFVHDKIGFRPPISRLMSVIGLVWTGSYFFYSLFIKPVRDTGNFIEPFRQKCVCDKIFSQAVDAIGMIDELLSFHNFAQATQHAATLPMVTDEDRHYFEARGLKNPVIARDRKDFVPNNVRMKGARLTFISGPNSGGKTTICKSIVHNQLLAQIGSHVLAETAAINIADMICYQSPKFDGLNDAEGRFGTELSRTRDIFYSTSPKSLVILDELAEGTTYEETLNVSYEILSDFHTIGNNTILVTHNHSLADRFMNEQKGQCLMFEFKQDSPTYHMIPGISRRSRANRVVKKLKFSKKDRHQSLQEKGYS